MKRLLLSLLLLCGMSTSAAAATEALEVYYLPISDAAEAVRSQLSANGKIAPIPSRRMLVIEDDRQHINKAKALLKKLDQPAPQFTAVVEIEDISSRIIANARASGAVRLGKLPGGWVQLALGKNSQHHNSSHLHQLRISAAEAARLETGTIRSFSRETRLWLSGYGIVQANSVEMIPITSGFNVVAWPVGTDQVRVRITPWMQRLEPQVSGRHEMLIDLGTARDPATPPSPNANMRLNASPQLQNNPVIEIAGASTEVTIPLDKTVTIAASSNEAGRLGTALLAGRSSVGKRDFVIHLRVNR
ncbi:type II and III secretion system family protein [Mariprofundus sp. NF]|uniref:secretin N-terminal domain-containing protein n=1 Tax=Mariprofundus sp. NF TaxID=2608716 RepID=UPI0015A0843F|nr:secretin N-terminal domain-containing protein [Mariprofundus sp. NF]NWF37575.1 type II and III secretion system family protein [Mariprofundus sp. NF]